MNKEIKNKKQLVGIVQKISGEKSVKVAVERKFPHKKYGKIIKTHKNYLVHFDGDMETVTVGDQVIIQETSPKSGKKSWILIK